MGVLDPSAPPPSAWAEIFPRMCLQRYQPQMLYTLYTGACYLLYTQVPNSFLLHPLHKVAKLIQQHPLYKGPNLVPATSSVQSANHIPATSSVERCQPNPKQPKWCFLNEKRCAINSFSSLDYSLVSPHSRGRGPPSTPLPCHGGRGLLLPPKKEQVPRNMSSNPVDSSHPLIVELLEMVLEVPGNISKCFMN